MSEKEYLILLSTFVPFGPARVGLLLEYFGKASKVWKAGERKLLELGLGEEKTKNFLQHRDNFDIDGYFNRLNRLKIEAATHYDKNFPENLKGLNYAPVVLYVKGTLKTSDKNAVAIVGSRKMSSYGREVTEKFSSELASFGITIISGLARGVDTVAHKSALLVSGRTIAVLGSGLDDIYPPENIALAKEIVAKGGALISEYPLGYPALPTNFANRNRIISGLSRAVLVIEGSEKSGTLLTASHAAEQGRTVFAVPGQITSPLSGAPLYLLKNGARIAVDSSDILSELDIERQVDKEEVEKILPSDSLEEKIYNSLETEELHIDEIARILSLDVSEVSARLTMMEIKGMIRSMGRGVYKKL